MLDRFKSFWQGVMLAPFVNLFIKLGISPDTVTLVGTLGVAAGALVFFPQGELLVGVLVITAFVFSDLIDGAMARRRVDLEVRRLLRLHARPDRRRRDLRWPGALLRRAGRQLPLPVRLRSTAW